MCRLWGKDSMSSMLEKLKDVEDLLMPRFFY